MYSNVRKRTLTRYKFVYVCIHFCTSLYISIHKRTFLYNTIRFSSDVRILTKIYVNVRKRNRNVWFVFPFGKDSDFLKVKSYMDFLICDSHDDIVILMIIFFRDNLFHTMYYINSTKRNFAKIWKIWLLYICVGQNESGVS